MARSAYIYLWLDTGGCIRGAYTVKYEAEYAAECGKCEVGWRLVRVSNGMNTPVKVMEFA